MKLGLELPMFEVSEGVREQTINIIDDLVDDIAPGYLSPNLFGFDYEMAIYERVYKFLLDELGMRRFENVYYRDEIFNLLREVPSEKFFNATEYLLKEMYRIVHIRRTIPDDILPNPHAGNKLWSRKESVRDWHISRFKGAVDILNHRLSQNNAKYCYDLSSGFVRMVSLDTGSDVPKGNNSIQEPNDNQSPEHHQNQSRTELWNRRNFIIGASVLFLTAVGVLFGNGILKPSLRWVWNHLPTILKDIISSFL